MHRSWRSRLRRGLLLALAAVLVLGVAIAATVGILESRCSVEPTASAALTPSRLQPAHRRDLVNTYLTYPEWSIVHAYEDLAGVMATGSESDFDYWGSIGGFWSSLCRLKRTASALGPISFDYNSMLYTIGFSFTGEMAVKGAWERTAGRLTAWIRGSERTPEDEFALAVAKDYAAFLQQVPWYEFPFGSKLVTFWREVPWSGGSLSRKLERRVALSLEWGAKAIYAKGIAALAGLNPAAVKIRSVISGASASAIDSLKDVTVIEQLPGDFLVIETPRYRAFTGIIRALAVQNIDFVEISGNQKILVTLLLPPGSTLPKDAGSELLNVDLQARPGWRRVGVDVDVPRLTALVRSLAGTPVVLEHIYDY